MSEIILADSWVKATLDELTFKITDGSHNPPPKQPEGLPMLSAQNVLNNQIVFDNYRLIEEKAFEEECKRANVEANDVLLTIVGTIGRASIVPENLPRFTLQRSVALIKPAIINSKWLTYYLQSRTCQNFFSSAEKGTAQKGVYLGTLKSLPIYLSPLTEQHRIVAKIEELFSELDKGIETLKRAKQQLKVYRQAVLKYAFEGKLTNPDVKEGELPEGWLETTIKDVCMNIKVGIVIKPTNYYSNNGTGIKAFRSANVREFRVNDTNWVHFSVEANEQNFRTKVFTGDVLLVRSGYPGTSCVVTEKFSGCNAIDILIATPKIDFLLPEYLCAFNNSPLGKGMFAENAHGVAQKHLNVGEYSRLKIFIPEISKQREVLNEIESRLSVCDKIEESIEQGLQQAEALRQSILKKAFEGKLVPQDPNDEPASVLLERIKAERASVQPEKKSRIKKVKA